MNIGNLERRLTRVILVLPVILVSSVAWGQGEQRLTEGVIIGPVMDNNNGDQGLFNPLFESLAGEPDYSTFVPPAAGRDLKDVAIAPDGRTIVLDGNLLRIYRRVFDSESQQFIAVEEAEINCTMLMFTAFKKNGTPLPDQTLSSCAAVDAFEGGFLRIAGQSGNGGGFDIIGYDLQTGDTALKAAGTPPEITAIVGDLAEKTGQGQVYYWIGERKKVGKSDYVENLTPTDPLNLESFEVIATLNGKRIDDLTILDEDLLAVITDEGELFQVNVETGNVQQVDYPPFRTDLECGIGRKDPQTYSLSNLGGLIYVSNRGCYTIKVLNGELVNGAFEQVQELVLDTPDQDPLMPQFLYPERLEVFAGRGGDFQFCGDTEATGCPLALEPDGGVMWGLSTVAPLPTLYREFEFVVPDCRLTNDANCPVGPNGELDLTELWLRTPDGPLFAALAFPDGEVQSVLLPGYLTAQTRVPRDSATPPVDCSGEPIPGDCIEVAPEIVSIVIVTDALFTGTFFVDYRLNQFLPDGANDQCIPLPVGSTVGEANEVYPPIVYHSTDEFGTVDRGVGLPGGVPGTRGGYIMTDLCNDRGSGARWSSNTINVQFTDSAADALVLQAHRMVGELGQVVDNLICDSFAPGLDPLLDRSGQDCAALESEMNQIFVKFDVCIKSLFDPEGNSAENCNALDTKTTNFKARIDAADWPDPFDSDNFAVLKPNYQGELESRLAAFVFFMENFVIKAVPQDGNGIPGEPPPQLPPLLLN